MLKSNVKIHGIKKAVGEAKEWNNRSYGDATNVMLDTETGEVWTDIFTDCNTWKEYHKESIHSVTGYIRMHHDNKEINMKNVKLACIKMMEDFKS